MNTLPPEDCDLNRLQQNLEEDLKRFSNDSYRVIEDFVTFKDSIIWKFSDQYYQSKGILAWSNNAPKTIPNKYGTSYQNALAFAKILRTSIENYPSGNRVKVLELGAGSGRFSRNLLFALRELDLADKVQLIISDYSKTNLESIHQAKILEDFVEGKDYELLHYDLLQPINTIHRFRAIFLHYVLDALPLTILRKSEFGFEELFISSKIRSEYDIDVLQNDFLQSRIIHEDKWEDYKLKLSLEKKYWDFFSDYHKATSNKELYYAYNSFAAIENLIELIEDNGFIFNTDISPGGDKRYVVVGNSLALEVDNHIIKSLVEAKGFCTLIQEENSISRLLITKNSPVLDTLTKIFDQVFIKQNLIQGYIRLEEEIEDALEKNAIEDLEIKLNKLLTLAPHYAPSYELCSKYYQLINNQKLAEEYIVKARTIDYWQDLKTE
jgi:hypothetical protein